MVDGNSGQQPDSGQQPPLWTPSQERVGASAMEAFRLHVVSSTGRSLADYDALHSYSTEQPDEFWRLLAGYLQVPFGAFGHKVRSPDPMPHTRWFEGSTLNYAQALLHPGLLADDDAVAVISVTEEGADTRLTWRQLRRLVARVQAGIERAGLKEGDAVAAFSANVPETVALLLACAGLGLVFSSCSPDFGWQAAAARFAQLKPKLLFASMGYAYGGKWFDTSETVAALAEALTEVQEQAFGGIRSRAESGERQAQQPGVGAVVALPYPGRPDVGGHVALTWSDWLGGGPSPAEPVFKQLPFDHPLYVLYSSGTTGVPKAMVHRAGGVLLTHMKEQRLHSDIGPGDVVYYFSTCGWMMWNWLVSALAQAATIVLYDGSPAWPDPAAQFELAERLGVTFFGTSARFISEIRAQGLEPGASHDLASIRTVASTGSPLSAEGFAYVYESVKKDVHLASISGGTDIVSCFMLGVPTLPVYAGQIQRPGLGVDLKVLDEDGNDVVGLPGELVCAQPLPSMPINFLADDDFGRYESAYLRDYPGMWRHGDLVQRTPVGGVVVYGRSDATLNPGGVRIGTAEIYRPLEQLPEIAEAVAVAKRVDGDQEIWLLVTLKEDVRLSEELIARIKGAVRQGASPRHVPRRVVQVPQLPRTRSGKSMELAVARLVNGESVPNIEVMANPGCVPLIQHALRDQA